MKDNKSVLDISDVLRSDGISEAFECGVDLSSLDTAFENVSICGSFKNIAGVLTVKCVISGDYSCICDRCLSPLLHHLKADINTPVDCNGSEDDSVSVCGGKIDLIRTAYDALSLELPTVSLCSEDCKGLCPVCGANLNNGPCKCGC